MKCGLEATAKAYILYRANRTRIREANTSLMKTIDEITNVDARDSDMKRDNANIDGNTAMGSMLQIGTAGAKAYNEAYLLTPEQAKAYREGDIHIHDFDFYSLTTTCTQIDIIAAVPGRFFHRPRLSAGAPEHSELRRLGRHCHPVQPERPARRPEHPQL